jgi:hypothetical protein
MSTTLSRLIMIVSEIPLILHSKRSIDLVGPLEPSVHQAHHIGMIARLMRLSEFAFLLGVLILILIEKSFAHPSEQMYLTLYSRSGLIQSA